MHVLYVHQNFPAQFGHLAGYLAREFGFRCTFLSQHAGATVAGVERMQYALKGAATSATHPLSRSFENFTWHTHAVYEALKTRPDVRPDIVVGHSGFGSTLFIPELYRCPVINLCEWFYLPDGSDSDFFCSQRAESGMRARSRNAMLLADLQSCNLGYCPTNWQRSRIPHEYQAKLSTIFDGVDTDVWRRRELPAEKPLALGGHDIPRDARIVTYVSRGFESMRGFDVFIEVARRLCAARPDLVVVCVGSDRVCYGDDLAQIQEKSFREHVLARVKIDPSRIKFTGRLPPEELAVLLSVSDLHLYLTAPFVLSWSLINAMACGCTVLASDTPPVREVIEHGRNGLLAPYRDVDRFVSLTLEVLEDPPAFRKTMGSSAVESIDEKYSLKRVAPRMVELYQRAMDGGLEKSLDDASVPNARQSGLQPGRGLRALQKRHPWPKAQPVGVVAKRRWLGPDAEQMLAETVGVEPRIVLHLGAWCGHSTRQLAELWPGCHIIAVDHWPGCRRKEGHPDWKSMFSEPFVAFLRNCWEWRRRVTALRLTFVDAVREVAEHGIAPDVVCAELDYDSAMAVGAMHCIRSTFPRAIVVGIGWHWWGVREAVLGATLGEELEVRGDAWCLRPRSAVGVRPRSIESGKALARV